MLVSFMVIIIIVGVFLGQTFSKQLAILPPGWEIYNQVGALRQNDTIRTEAEDFMNPRFLSGPVWKVDWDDPRYRVPTIQVVLGDISHVDAMGKPIPSTQIVENREVERGNHTYYLDYHIYHFSVSIRTLADKAYNASDGLWWHETSAPSKAFLGAFGWTKIGKPFEGGAYVKFIVSPWIGGTYRAAPNSSYVLERCWAGIMNAYVFEVSSQQVRNQWGDKPNPNHDYYVKGLLNRGGQVPMFKDDGTFGTSAPTVDWDLNVTPDIRIESTVVLFLPVDMMAGAYVKYNAWDGHMEEVYPCDVEAIYTIRVDVLTVHDFVLQTSYKPPMLKWAEDFFSWSLSFWDGLWNFFGLLNPFRMFGDTAGMVAFIALTMIGLVALWIIVKIVVHRAVPARS